MDGIVAVIALCYALWVIKTGASDIKRSFSESDYS